MEDNSQQNAFDKDRNELEYKYSADSVSIEDFLALAGSIPGGKRVDVGSWDKYYANVGKVAPFDFFRYRQGKKPELTIKMKSVNHNNNDRLEIDLPLDPSADQDKVDKLVTSMVELLGFKFNVKIYKDCRIFFYEQVSLVQYIVFNEEMKETGRYIEIEANKDYNFASKEEAWQAVLEMEKRLSALGLTAKNRMRRSQWEINRKEIKNV